MDIQERLAFEKSLQKRHKNILRWVMWVESIQNYVMNPKTERHDDVYADKAYRKIQDFLYAWQAAKAQAVPEGFVLVKRVHPDAIVHNQGLGLFKECQVIYGWDGKSKDFKDALNKGFYHGVKLGAKAVLETAMIEAQEQK